MKSVLTARARSKVRQLTGHNTTGQDLSFVVGAINRRLRGWGNYFRWGNSTKKFGQVDIYVHQRLAIWMSKERKLARSRKWDRFD
jgi:RNA-directed DNA polymerase